MWSSSYLGAQTAAPLEHQEQQLSGTEYSGSTGASGAAPSSEHRSWLHLSTWSSCFLGMSTVVPMDHVEQPNYQYRVSVKYLPERYLMMSRNYPGATFTVHLTPKKTQRTSRRQTLADVYKRSIEYLLSTTPILLVMFLCLIYSVHTTHVGSTGSDGAPGAAAFCQ